jgi:hypothetical protein
MNRELLILVRDTIKDHHEQFNYRKWLSESRIPSFEDDIVQNMKAEVLHTCNSSGCVAGWTCAIEAPHTTYTKIEETARFFLDLNDDETDFLFFCYERFGFDKIQLRDATHQDAIERINYLLSEEYANAE